MIFVFAPGAGSRPLPKGFAILFLLLSPGLFYLAYDMAFIPPTPRVLTCTRTGEEAIACQPGDLHGARAVLEHQSSKTAKDCFTLADDPRWRCTAVEGAAAAGVARVNALAIGASTEVDVTEQKIRAMALLPLFFAITMLIGSLQRLRR